MPATSVLDLIGKTPLVEVTRSRHRPVPAVPQARKPESRRLDQGPHRAVDDRGGRARRPAEARRHDRRGDRRQHRPRPGAGRHPEGLPPRPGRPRQDGAREDPAPARAGRRGAHDALRRRQGPPRVLPGHGASASPPRCPAPSTSTSSPTRPTRWRTRPRTGPEIWEQMERRRRRGRGRRRLGRHAHRPRPLLRAGLAEDRDGAGRPGRLGAGAARQDRARWSEAGSLDGRRHRRGLRAAELPTCRWSSKAYSIPDAESFGAARDLLRKEGILAGSSSGTLLAAALRYCREQTTPKRVVTFVCDSGNKYLSKMFNDFWMADQGLLEREQHGDLRDLIARRYGEGGTRDRRRPTTRCSPPISRMRSPTSRSCRCWTTAGSSASSTRATSSARRGPHDEPLGRFDAPVAQRHDVASCTPCRPTQPLDALLPIFERDEVAIVIDGDEFLGLITRIDLINHLRRTRA